MDASTHIRIRKSLARGSSLITKILSDRGVNIAFMRLFREEKGHTAYTIVEYLLQDEIGNIQLAHSISAGLDYPGVGPEHAYLRDSGRAKYVSVTDKECMDALMELCRMEGIIPAIESAHALAHVFKMAQGEYKGKTIIMCLSGRGDKDVNTVQKYLNGEETNK